MKPRLNFLALILISHTLFCLAAATHHLANAISMVKHGGGGCFSVDWTGRQATVEG